MTMIWMDSDWACLKLVCELTPMTTNWLKDTIHFCCMKSMKMNRVGFGAIVDEFYFDPISFRCSNCRAWNRPIIGPNIIKYSRRYFHDFIIISYYGELSYCFAINGRNATIVEFSEILAWIYFDCLRCIDWIQYISCSFDHSPRMRDKGFFLICIG